MNPPEGDLYASIDEKTGKVKKEDVEAAHRFLAVERKAKKLLGI